MPDQTLNLVSDDNAQVLIVGVMGPSGPQGPAGSGVVVDTAAPPSNLTYDTLYIQVGMGAGGTDWTMWFNDET